MNNYDTFPANLTKGGEDFIHFMHNYSYGVKVRHFFKKQSVRVAKNTRKYHCIDLCSDIELENSIPEDVKKNKFLNYKSGYSYIGTKDVGFDNAIDYNNGVRIPFDEKNFKIAKKGTVLLCIEGGSAGRKIGITEQDVCFGNKLCKFYSEKVYNKYIFYYLLSDTFKSNFMNNLTGLIDGVSIGTIRKMYIPLPPLAEQHRIVEMIEKLIN